MRPLHRISMRTVAVVLMGPDRVIVGAWDELLQSLSRGL